MFTLFFYWLTILKRSVARSFEVYTTSIRPSLTQPPIAVYQFSVKDAILLWCCGVESGASNCCYCLVSVFVAAHFWKDHFGDGQSECNAEDGTAKVYAGYFPLSCRLPRRPVHVMQRQEGPCLASICEAKSTLIFSVTTCQYILNYFFSRLLNYRFEKVREATSFALGL